MAFKPISLSKEFLLTRRYIDPITNCWEWTGATLATGYGRVKSFQNSYRVHRLAAHFWLGLDLNDSTKYACHLCDNKLCFNPDHLKIADNKWNQLDALKKGILKQGQEAHQAKLTESEVLELVELRKWGFSLPVLSDAYNISISQIHRIERGETWKGLLNGKTV